MLEKVFCNLTISFTSHIFWNIQSLLQGFIQIFDFSNRRFQDFRVFGSNICKLKWYWTDLLNVFWLFLQFLCHWMRIPELFLDKKQKNIFWPIWGFLFHSFFESSHWSFFSLMPSHGVQRSRPLRIRSGRLRTQPIRIFSASIRTLELFFTNAFLILQ